MEGTGVGRFAETVDAAFVTDADGAFVVARTVLSQVLEVAHADYQSAVTDVIVEAALRQWIDFGIKL